MNLLDKYIMQSIPLHVNDIVYKDLIRYLSKFSQEVIEENDTFFP
ncbi:hypothetical protein ADICYQ_2316 [Cyclobacterium qasimii M12-11B]|uniref:Uncharacterized protein n=1 Tax=Cyclobacterium qasimii M12-11B TaxID=641524 RepID=S7WPF6_9BACT|nr:hypothetical protein ADICYQ_2316 [Cyclobacterium qasimii M12-11B]